MADRGLWIGGVILIAGIVTMIFGEQVRSRATDGTVMVKV
jgi:hypothetical protein